MSSTLSTSSSASKGTVGTWGKGKTHLKRGKSGISRCLKQPVVTAPNETFLKVKRFSKKTMWIGAMVKLFSFLPTSRLHPLASWLSAMLSCFAGGILVSRPTRWSLWYLDVYVDHLYISKSKWQRNIVQRCASGDHARLRYVFDMLFMCF